MKNKWYLSFIYLDPMPSRLKEIVEIINIAKGDPDEMRLELCKEQINEWSNNHGGLYMPMKLNKSVKNEV